MSNVAQPAPSAAITATKETNWFASNWGLIAAFAALVAILLLPTPANLPVAGHHMLAILAFAVILWMTEAIDYAVSAIVIAVLMAFLLGLAPSVANPKVLLGTSAALDLAFSGFANTALVLVASALFLAAAMTATGLDKRIALTILSRVGTKTRTRRHRHDPGRLRHRIDGAVDHRARRLPGADHARHHRRLRRQQAQRLRRHADDHHGADRQHLECRHQDRGGAEHGRHRLHREDLQPDHHLAELVHRRRAVRGPDVRRALFRHDAHDDAGSHGSARRSRRHPQVAGRARADEGRPR